MLTACKPLTPQSIQLLEQDAVKVEADVLQTQLQAIPEPVAEPEPSSKVIPCTPPLKAKVNHA